MGLPFNLPLSANTKFLRVGEVPALTAKAIHPEYDNDSEAQGFARAGCQINHEEALDRAIRSEMVTPLNPLSYEQHTFPFGDALRRAIISLDDFKRFAASLQIKVVIRDEPAPTQDSDDGIPGKMPTREAGKLAIKAAWQIECTTKRRASAKEVMSQLQAWADAGEQSDALIKSLPTKRAVQWLTAKGDHREYTMEACGKTLAAWHKSRQ